MTWLKFRFSLEREPDMERRLFQPWFLAAFALNVIVLLTLDHLHPDWPTLFKTPLDRYLDLATGFLVSVVACILMLWVVVANHARSGGASSR
ncbi:hypothetical protein [Geothrix limicola]|nr:hypothetical protein [Geothrix limicola]